LAYNYSPDAVQNIIGIVGGRLKEIARLSGDTYAKLQTTDPAEKMNLYTNSYGYIVYTGNFHHGMEMISTNHFLLNLMKDKKQTIIDVGCQSGGTGLLYAHYGHRVIFHDFDGVAFRVLEKYIAQFGETLDVEIISYGKPLPSADWVISFDTIEHTGNHLGFLRWIESMANNFAITYPLTIPFEPPFVPPGLDEWVDDERLQAVINADHEIIQNRRENGRRILMFRRVG